jgi:hypothetical protein
LIVWKDGSVDDRRVIAALTVARRFMETYRAGDVDGLLAC